MMRGRLLLLLLLLALPVLSSAPAQADLRACNQTSYVLYLAGGFQTKTGIFTHGWTRIVPGDCSEVISDELTGAIYYLYARSSDAHSGPARAWGGGIKLCGKDTNFALQTPLGKPSCQGDDVREFPFAVVSTHGRKSWTTTLTESPLVNSLDLARAAGVVRLLNDIGYKVGKGDSDGNKSRDGALIQLRARLKLPVTATNADLFAALETEALKASAPEGYSVCNDGESDIWSAIALKTPANWESRGWWKIAPHACAKMLTDPLSTDKVYVLAANAANDHFVSGPNKFCVTSIEFDVLGRDKCAGQGLKEAGFAETDTKGRTGYAAHIGRNGLLPPVPQIVQARTSK